MIFVVAQLRIPGLPGKLSSRAPQHFLAFGRTPELQKIMVRSGRALYARLRRSVQVAPGSAPITGTLANHIRARFFPYNKHPRPQSYSRVLCVHEP